jgi:hypothetical protein
MFSSFGIKSFRYPGRVSHEPFELGCEFRGNSAGLEQLKSGGGGSAETLLSWGRGMTGSFRSTGLLVSFSSTEHFSAVLTKLCEKTPTAGAKSHVGGVY